jgi:hypothetical protein
MVISFNCQACAVLFETRGAARVAGQLEDVQAGVGAIADIDVAAIVGLDVVALDRDLAAVLAVNLNAALVGPPR